MLNVADVKTFLSAPFLLGQNNPKFGENFAKTREQNIPIPPERIVGVFWTVSFLITYIVDKSSGTMNEGRDVEKITFNLKYFSILYLELRTRTRPPS
jgi:hypothetical protein